MSRMAVNFFNDEIRAHAAIRRLNPRRATISYSVIYVPGGVRLEWNVRAPTNGSYHYNVPFKYPMPCGKLRILQQRARIMMLRPSSRRKLLALPKKVQGELRARGYDIQPRRPFPPLRVCRAVTGAAHSTVHESTHCVIMHMLGGEAVELWSNNDDGFWTGEASTRGGEQIYSKLLARLPQSVQQYLQKTDPWGGPRDDEDAANQRAAIKTRRRNRRKIYLADALSTVAPFFAEIDLLGHITGWVEADGFYIAERQFDWGHSNSVSDFQHFKKNMRELQKYCYRDKHKIDREQFVMRWARVLVWRHRDAIRRVAAAMLKTPDYSLSAEEFLAAMHGRDVMQVRHVERSYQRNLELAEAAGDYWGD